MTRSYYRNGPYVEPPATNLTTLTAPAHPTHLPVQHRAMTVELDSLQTRAEGDGRIPVALSSESPVERYFGTEILSHEPGAIDLIRAATGLPFLDGHDATRQIGKIEDVRLGADRKLRGMLRMGNHPDAVWIQKDIEAGIRSEMSIGYQINTLELDRTDGDVKVYRATKWTPLEGSSVAIPADTAVGVGRAHDGEARAISLILPSPIPALEAEERTMLDADKTPAPAGPSFEEVRKEAAAIAVLAAEHGMSDLVGEWLGRGLSRDRVAAEILERKRATVTPAPSPAGHLDLSPTETRQYNLARAISETAAAMVGGHRAPNGIEREASDAIAKRLNQPSRGLYVPMDIQIRASLTGNIAGTSSVGGAGVQTSILSLLELLRNRMQVRNLGATVLSGLTSNVSFPRQITSNSFTWSGENPSAANTLTAATLDNVTLSPKTAMVSTSYSRQLLVQASFDVNAFVMNDLALVNAIGLDAAAINGVGSSNQPTGIRVQTGITNTALGTNGAIPAWADIVGMETSVATNNADIGSLAFLTTPGMRGKLKTVLRSTTAGAYYLWADDSTMNGYRAEVSAQVPSNLTKGTSTTVAHSIIFGVWSELLIGEFGGAMDLIVDPYTGAGQNMIVVNSILMADIGVKHPKAFVKIDDALIA